MKLRSDSPFVGLSSGEQFFILETAGRCTMEQLISEVERLHPGLEFSESALRRFVQRMREEELREEMEDSGEAMEDFAKAGKSGRARDGVLEAMRRKMFAEALEAKNSASAMVVFRMMKEEQKEDRAATLAERRMALEEEHAKQEWKRQELEDARSALRLLPKLAGILMEGEGTAEERLGRAREVLMVGGGKLLQRGYELILQVAAAVAERKAEVTGLILLSDHAYSRDGGAKVWNEMLWSWFFRRSCDQAHLLIVLDFRATRETA